MPTSSVAPGQLTLKERPLVEPVGALTLAEIEREGRPELSVEQFVDRHA